MAFCLGKGWGFGPAVVFAIGHRQEKGITAAPSPQWGLACPRPWALPSLLQPQKPTAKSHRRCRTPAPARGAEWRRPAPALGPPRRYPHGATPGSPTTPLAPPGWQKSGRALATDPRGSYPPRCSCCQKKVWLTSPPG